MGHGCPSLGGSHRICVFRVCRNIFWILSSLESRQPRPHRSSSLRVGQKSKLSSCSAPLISSPPDAIFASMLEADKIIHEILPVGMLQCNCHIIGDPKTLEALVIDPGDDAEKILEIICRHKLRVTAIAITHTHIDHVGGLRRLQKATGAPVRMHADDLELYRMLDVQAAWIGWEPPEKVEVGELLREGDAVRWGRYEAEGLHTPGPTQGSVCLYMPSEIPSPQAPPLFPNSTDLNPANLFPG